MGGDIPTGVKEQICRTVYITKGQGSAEMYADGRSMGSPDGNSKVVEKMMAVVITRCCLHQVGIRRSDHGSTRL